MLENQLCRLMSPLTLLLVSLGIAAAAELKSAVQGLHCANNQVVNKVTFYEDGAIEAECGPIPCGNAGGPCIEEQASCKLNTPYVFSGMKWAENGKSLALRCCTLNVGNKMYVGTDTVSQGSFYSGGVVATKDKYGHGGTEYDFVSGIRAEQNGLRIWVHRIMCASEQPVASEPAGAPVEVRRAPAKIDGTPTAVSENRSLSFEKRRQYLVRQLAESQDTPVQSAAVEEPVNPLRYRPRSSRSADPLVL